MSYFKDKIR